MFLSPGPAALVYGLPEAGNGAGLVSFPASRMMHGVATDEGPVPAGFVLAGFVAGSPWEPPREKWTATLPGSVPTVSDCLADLLPADRDPLVEPWQHSMFEPWHRSVRYAVDAVRHAPAGSDPIHVLSMSVPATAAAELAAMLEQWIGHLPHPVRVNLAHRAAPPPGTVLGFEVLGFGAGRFHTWLCYDVHSQAHDLLGIRPGDSGLLAELHDAQRVADMANSKRGTEEGTPEEITWFPALLTLHDVPARG
ncbi:hypothetical protein SAMN05443668_109236 [Cryptosporangium aurantiacum]|uniref:Uncharacterized protein n=1 Tax=Cryptosporangium aurantiacum TaxID=134849 RepID=A0A1M7RBD3_9ACTN|nr:hypothetical protein SAMN05443668_109236 [Cryptosporangium aurantiacum]